MTLPAFDKMKDFIKRDVSLDEELRNEYLKILEKASEFKELEPEETIRLLNYLENIFLEAEEDALRKNDTETINNLAAIREERNALMTLMLTGGKNNINTNKNDEIEKIKQILHKQVAS